MNFIKEWVAKLTPTQKVWYMNMGFGLILAGILIVGYIYIVDKPRLQRTLDTIKECPDYNIIVNGTTINNAILGEHPEFLCCYGCRMRKYNNYSFYEDTELSQCNCDGEFELWSEKLKPIPQITPNG